jgi:hypothetical protein
MEDSIKDFHKIIFLHFWMIFKNNISEKKLKDPKKVAKLLQQIVSETELPDLPKTSVSYKIIKNLLEHIDWNQMAVECLKDNK